MDHARVCRVVVAAGLLLSLTGCGRYYWGKPNATADQFKSDNDACLQEARGASPATARYGVVVQDVYRACLRTRGYVRDKQFEPVSAGWYRGFEDD